VGEMKVLVHGKATVQGANLENLSEEVLQYMESVMEKE
jgi:hypothetical protein